MQNRKDKKFFFDTNIFDDDFEDEEEDLPPPPPTFSETELEQAKAEAFKQGKQEGIEEIKNSLEQANTNALNNIAREITSLYEAEEKRALTFENEAVMLSLAIFEQLFPVYFEKEGFKELQNSISAILKKQHGPIDIAVKVHPDNMDGINKTLSSIENQGHEAVFHVSPDETLSLGTCRINWANGGAIHDTNKLAEDIKNTLKTMLPEQDSEDKARLSAENTDVTDTNYDENGVESKTSSVENTVTPDTQNKEDEVNTPPAQEQTKDDKGETQE